MKSGREIRFEVMHNSWTQLSDNDKAGGWGLNTTSNQINQPDNNNNNNIDNRNDNNNSNEHDNDKAGGESSTPPTTR